MRALESNGLRFAALEWGSGPLVLLFHGFPDSAHTWELIGPRIAAAGYRVVAPFLRGYAPSALPEKEADTETLGRDVLGLIEALGEQRAILIGHDWGAEAVLSAVALDPQRVSRLVTVAIPPRAAVPLTPSLLWALRHFLTLSLPGAEAAFARDDLAMLEVFWKRWSPSWRYTASELEETKAVFRQEGVVHAALGYYRAARFRTPGFLKARIAVPTLAIAGADDPGVSPAVFEQARPHFLGPYEVAAISGGHFCHREAPEAFLRAVLPFLARDLTVAP